MYTNVHQDISYITYLTAREPNIVQLVHMAHILSLQSWP
jgi:hypothetical protein